MSRKRLPFTQTITITINPPPIMKTSTKAQFEKELNERLSTTVKTMFENDTWKEIFSHLSKEQVAETIAMVFLSTNIQKGSEQAFINAVMALNK